VHVQDNRNTSVGIVAIGRNEGERLRSCLESIHGQAATVVYVDSASTDGSRELARELGAEVVELDLSTPFTAARARNAGFERLLELAPDTEFVQFVDGDCALQPEWIRTAILAFRGHEDLAVVCGRRRERYPERSVYNRLCDVEWDTPLGRTRACGGDALMRVEAFREAHGYDPAMIAGEEPDLCLRMQRAGHWILRQDCEMTLHDAAMTRWTQWWQRAVRTGHTTAELLAKYGRASEHRRMRRALSALFWAVGVPFGTLCLSIWALWRLDFLLFAAVLIAIAPAYVVLLTRIQRSCLRRGRSIADARAYALSCALAKWPEVWGMVLYSVRRASGKRASWIEYKDVPAQFSARLESALPRERGSVLSHSN